MLTCNSKKKREREREILNIYSILFFHDRLFWPKSKSFDYLYSDGEALLRNFPVQATICFYDESDSEDDEDEQDDWEDEEDADDKECHKPQGRFCDYN